MRVRSLTVVLATGLLLGGCATGGGAPSGDRSHLISTEQIEAYNGDNVYLLIQSLHPTWLRERGQVSMRLASPVQVYFDGMQQMDGVNALRSLMPHQALEIRYLDSREATNRFGTNHTNGAIMVKLR